MSKYFTQYDPVKNLFEPKNSGEILVETAGYLPAKQQIESMIIAGRNLEEFRKGVDGFETDEEALDGYDPTSDYDYTMADGKRDLDAFSEKVKEVKSQPKKEPEEPKKEPEKATGEDKSDAQSLA